MAYKRKITKFKNVIEVEEYHTCRYGAPGMGRMPKKKKTPEMMERQNQRNREKSARHKLRANYQSNDYFTTLTYSKESRPPDMKMAKEHFQKFIRDIRKEYKKRGAELKWMRNIEQGSKNAWHIHIVVNRIPDTDIILRNAWRHGGVYHVLLYEKGDFADLAAYITKTPKTDSRLKDASYSTSRNLPVPEPRVKIMKGKKWKKEPRPPKGWVIDKNTMYEGINPVTGFLYRGYTLIRLNRRI